MLQKALLPISLAAALFALAACGDDNNSPPPSSSTSTTPPAATVSQQDAAQTATPIKHLVVIFQENRSFDHYFGTYPNAANPAGEPKFVAAAGTPTPIGLTTALLQGTSPTKANTLNGANAVNSFRLDRTQANTEGQNHNYTPEQLAEDNGAMDLFPLETGNNTISSTGVFGTNGLVMGYYDGNTVTAYWNYAQNFAMNDNNYTDTFGPSTPGAIAVVSGTNNGAVAGIGTSSSINDTQGGLSLIGDTDPIGDACSSKSSTVGMSSKNIGDLLNAKSLTWGGFMGGFDLTATNPNGTTGCSRSTFSSVLGGTSTDYSPHHAWFQYYTSTANTAHTRPTSTALVGFTDPKDNSATPVHHQYDLNDFFAAVSSGNYPSVSYLKMPEVGDGHPGNSDPLDEQAAIVNVVNFLQQQPDWKNTAIIITYDDSDGWFDHRFTAPTTSSFDSTTSESRANGQSAIVGADQLTGPGQCNAPGATQGVGLNGGAVNGRCGPGTRVPMVVISPYAKKNFIDDTAVTQASVVRFIEDNWLGGQRIGQGSNDATTGSIMNMFDFTQNVSTPRTLFLDPNQGTPLAAAPQS
ncbi:phospholipase C [Burkholderia plantarii]|uniref:phospholipase C n=1 Tax=Burkholderia plantarii TaxID=41899 RepID=UPI0018DCFB36|nr:alkaline phosphatase family protein [Burkholderia plantarii]MBI0328538.1 alkaline phosphatase family protein [Burkholderia plantarii]